ncbi:MAG: archaeal flagellar protein FlaG [Thermoplasmata archaeon]|jgi:archaellum component FlaG (FlaF/FlaG flagellin family)|nr:archaeal flagellar protein FlaG [Thermoplasmata archaeon]
MAGSAASETILFIGAVAAAALLAGALAGVTGHYTTGLRDRSKALEAELTSRIAIVNDPANVPTGPLLLYVKNTGSRALTLDTFVILVDGVASADWAATVGGVAALGLKPGQLATLTVNDLAVPAGDHRAVVVADAGASAALDFQV